MRPHNFNPRRNFRATTSMRLEQHPLFPRIAGAVANPGGASGRRTDRNHTIDPRHCRTDDLHLEPAARRPGKSSPLHIAVEVRERSPAFAVGKNSPGKIAVGFGNGFVFETGYFQSGIFMAQRLRWAASGPLSVTHLEQNTSKIEIDRSNPWAQPR